MAQIKIDPDKLRRARHKLGYSLREFGRVSNTDHNQLWMYENGRRNPQPRVIRRLAEALEVEVKNLLKGSKDDSENGYSVPHPRTRRRVAQALGVEPRDLRGGGQ